MGVLGWLHLHMTIATCDGCAYMLAIIPLKAIPQSAVAGIHGFSP
jgi:hypothetical protein